MKMLNHVKDSVHNPNFYTNQRKASVGQAFGYFFKFLIFVSLILTIFGSFVFIQEISKFTSSGFLTKLSDNYPAELQITIKSGKASTNVDEPYAIALPPGFFDPKLGQATSSSIANMVVIDTTHPFMPDQFANYKTIVLITRDFIVSPDKGGKLSLQPFRAMSDTVITRTKVVDFINAVAPYLKLVYPIVIITIFVASYVFNAVIYLFLLLIVSVIIWIISLIRKQGISYGTWYKLGLYAVTTALVVDMVLYGAAIHVPWYVDVIITLIILLVNVKKDSSIQTTS